MYDKNQVDRVLEAVRSNLSDDLRKPKYQGHPNPMHGHCYVASEALYHLLGGKESGFTPHWVNHGPKDVEGKNVHIFLKHKDGHVIDPTHDQFNTIVPYGKGKAFGWMGPDGNEGPSDRTKFLIDRIVNEGKIGDLLIEQGFLPYEEKVSKALDFKIGKSKTKFFPGGHTKTTDYTHILPKKLQKEGYSIEVDTTPFETQGVVSVNAQLKYKKGKIGSVDGGLQDNIMEVNMASIQDEHRGKGLGLALYEAALSHAKNALGATHAGGFSHSSSARKVHLKLAKKHGLDYEAVPNITENTGPLARYKTQQDWEKAPDAPFDDKWSSYQYPLNKAVDENELKTIMDKVATARPDDSYEANRQLMGIAAKASPEQTIQIYERFPNMLYSLSNNYNYYGSRQNYDSINALHRHVIQKAFANKDPKLLNQVAEYSKNGDIMLDALEGARALGDNAPLDTHSVGNLVYKLGGSEAQNRRFWNWLKGLPPTKYDSSGTYAMSSFFNNSALPLPEDILSEALDRGVDVSKVMYRAGKSINILKKIVELGATNPVKVGNSEKYAITGTLRHIEPRKALWDSGLIDRMLDLKDPTYVHGIGNDLGYLAEGASEDQLLGAVKKVMDQGQEVSRYLADSFTPEGFHKFINLVGGYKPKYISISDYLGARHNPISDETFFDLVKKVSPKDTNFNFSEQLGKFLTPERFGKLKDFLKKERDEKVALLDESVQKEPTLQGIPDSIKAIRDDLNDISGKFARVMSGQSAKMFSENPHFFKQILNDPELKGAAHSKVAVLASSFVNNYSAPSEATKKIFDLIGDDLLTSDNPEVRTTYAGSTFIPHHIAQLAKDPHENVRGMVLANNTATAEHKDAVINGDLTLKVYTMAALAANLRKLDLKHFDILGKWGEANAEKFDAKERDRFANASTSLADSARRTIYQKAAAYSNSIVHRQRDSDEEQAEVTPEAQKQIRDDWHKYVDLALNNYYNKDHDLTRSVFAGVKTASDLTNEQWDKITQGPRSLASEIINDFNDVAPSFVWDRLIENPNATIRKKVGRKVDNLTPEQVDKLAHDPDHDVRAGLFRENDDEDYSHHPNMSEATLKWLSEQNPEGDPVQVDRDEWDDRGTVNRGEMYPAVAKQILGKYDPDQKFKERVNVKFDTTHLRAIRDEILKIGKEAHPSKISSAPEWNVPGKPDNKDKNHPEYKAQLEEWNKKKPVDSNEWVKDSGSSATFQSFKRGNYRRIIALDTSNGIDDIIRQEDFDDSRPIKDRKVNSIYIKLEHGVGSAFRDYIAHVQSGKPWREFKHPELADAAHSVKDWEGIDDPQPHFLGKDGVFESQHFNGRPQFQLETVSPEVLKVQTQEWQKRKPQPPVKTPEQMAQDTAEWEARREKAKLFTTPGGNISAEKIQRYIDAQPSTTYNISHSTWEGAQRHNDEDSKVLQVNVTTDMIKKLQQAGVMGTFLKMTDLSRQSGHPVNIHTIGWIRYTGDKERGIQVDEVQSDFGQSFARQMANQAREQYGDDEEAIREAQERAESEYPTEHYNKIKEIVFGDRHSNEMLHEVFQQHMRDQGMEGVKLAVHDIHTKAGLSNLDPSQEFPGHFHVTYKQIPKKMGLKPGKYGDLPDTQTEDDLKGKPQWNGEFHKKEIQKWIELRKFQPTPTLPKLGMPDDERETPILTNQTQLSTKALAFANAANKLRQILPKPKPISKKPSKNPKGWEEADNNGFDQRTDDISRARAPAGMSFGVPEIGTHVAWAKGRNLVQDLKLRNSIVSGPMGQFGTKMHEDFHNMMARVSQKYGQGSRAILAENLYNAIPAHYRKWVDMHSLFTNTSSNKPEEKLAYLINYMNDADFRERFFDEAKKQGRDYHKRRQEIDTALKRAYRLMRAAAEIAPVEWTQSVIQKSEGETEKTRIASIAVMSNGKLLMGKRNDSGKWTLPGGHVEEGESALDGAIRELKEETGLDASTLTYIGEGPAGRGDSLMIHCYRFDVDDELKTDSMKDPDEEVEAWKWIDISDGLPKDIKTNLHAKKNITLRLLGLQAMGDELLGKSLKEKFAALAAGAALSVAPAAISSPGRDVPVFHIPNDQTPHIPPKVTPKNRGWTADGLHQELHPIARLESNFGTNINHAKPKMPPGTTPHDLEMNTAFGALGFKPMTAFDEYSKSKHLMKLYPDFKGDAVKFLKEFKSNPLFYNTIANTHWNRLKASTGSVIGAAYAWRFGLTAAHKTHSDLQIAAPYVNAYYNMYVLGSKPPLQKSEVDEWVNNNQLANSVKYWRSKDGIKIPVIGTPERVEYDQNFFDALDQAYGTGVNQTLRPVRLDLNDGQIYTTNNIHNHHRYNMYLQMARGGDVLPPVIVQRSGSGLELIDGNHRWNAALKAKLNQIDGYEIVSPRK